MGFTKYTNQAEKERVRMNEGIRAPEVRVLGPEGENFGIMSSRDALAKAAELGFDLIEVSPNAQPPVCKITDYGKYKYEQKKKDKDVKSKARVVETKEAQVKIGTSDNDMRIKAGKVGAWLREGHRVKVDLFLWGRYKYMEFDFLKERLQRFLDIIPEGFKIAEEVKKSPKGLACTIERDLSKKPTRPAAPKPVVAPEAAAPDVSFEASAKEETASDEEIA